MVNMHAYSEHTMLTFSTLIFFHILGMFLCIYIIQFSILFFANVLGLSIHHIYSCVTGPLNAFYNNEVTYFNYCKVLYLNVFKYTVLHILFCGTFASVSTL